MEYSYIRVNKKLIFYFSLTFLQTFKKGFYRGLQVENIDPT